MKRQFQDLSVLGVAHPARMNIPKVCQTLWLSTQNQSLGRLVCRTNRRNLPKRPQRCLLGFQYFGGHLILHHRREVLKANLKSDVRFAVCDHNERVGFMKVIIIKMIAKLLSRIYKSKNIL